MNSSRFSMPTSKGEESLDGTNSKVVINIPTDYQSTNRTLGDRKKNLVASDVERIC